MSKLVYFLLSIAVALLFSVSTGIIITIIFGIITGYVICKKAKNYEEKNFLRNIYFIVYILGIAIAMVHFYLAAIIKNDSDLIGDASAYSSHGAYIAEVLTNKKVNVEKNYTDMEELYLVRNIYKGKLPPYGIYRMDFMTYLNGFFYAFFGYSPLMIKFLNSILGIIGCFLIYFWIKDTFGEKQAKIALLLILFLPSRLIWSTSGAKDTLVFFAFSLALFLFFKLNKKIGLLWTCAILFAACVKYDFVYIFLAFIIAICLLKRKEIISLLTSFILIKLAFILIHEVRPQFFWPFIIALGIASFVLIKRGKSILIFSMVVLSLFLHPKIDMNFIKAQYQAITDEVIGTHRGRSQQYYVKSQYKIYPDRFYNKNISIYRSPITLNELFISYLIGMSYHYFSPFPWELSTKNMLIGYIQMPVIYLLLPFITIGIIIGFRHHKRETMAYLFFIFIISSIVAMASGNVGSLFRHRDMVMPFFIAFGAIGLTKIFTMRHQ